MKLVDPVNGPAEKGGAGLEFNDFCRIGTSGDGTSLW
jgi:hypothetical protein